MRVNPKIIEELSQDAGTARTQKAHQYCQNGQVFLFQENEENYIDENNFEIKGEVAGTQLYETYLLVERGEIIDISCDCPDYENHYGVCKHTLATLLAFAKSSQEEKQNALQELAQKFSKNTIPFPSIKPEDTKYRNFKQIVNTFYHEEIEGIEESDKPMVLKDKGTIRIEPRLLYDRFSGEMKLEFKMGNKRMYKIKNLVDFYQHMTQKEFYRYGDKLQFIHTKEMFAEESTELLSFIMQYAEVIKYANSNANSNYRYYGKALSESSIVLSPSGLDDFFTVCQGNTIKIQKDYEEKEITFLDQNPDMYFLLNKREEDDYEIIPNVELIKLVIKKGKQYTYVWINDGFYRCTPEFVQSTLKLAQVFRENYLTEVHLHQEDLRSLFSIVMPKVKQAIRLGNVNEEEIKVYQPKELGVKVFLDFDEQDYLIAEVRFCYENQEFNPLAEEKDMDFPRNMVQETKALNVFHQTGFMLDVKNLRFILPEEEKIYEFLTEDIEYYMNKFEVLITDRFKTKQIIKPKMESLGVKVENDLLSIDLSHIQIDPEELESMMEQYRLKKKYHRLKNGAFVDLEQNEELRFMDQLVTGMDLTSQDLKQKEIVLPVNRTLYLNQLLKGMQGTEVIKNQEYREIVQELEQETIDKPIILPHHLQADLRYYQKIGYQWLQVLDHYHFGGILADDMGLGKTIQILAILLAYQQSCKNEEQTDEYGKQTNQEAQEVGNQTNQEEQEVGEQINQKEQEVGKQINQEEQELVQESLAQKNDQIENTKRKTSLVVSPSSLTLNWLNESQKFTPDLQVQVVHGTAAERKKQIENLEQNDVLITSYDLLKRDIAVYQEKNYLFRYIIADEAQYLKNSNTQNAKAMKQLKADTRFALTGTPIENSLAELWSIFDFVMPGYLFTYKKFKSTYETAIVKDEDESAMKKLKMLIEPFVLRRTKREVLTELPDKTISVLKNEMQEEQEKLYLSYLAQAKQEVAEQINQQGFERSQIKILAALTRLRQVCCHPGLFIENYQGTSSKLEQCMEIVEEAVSSGHKILLFSTYTSMFSILGKELSQRNISYYQLTGATKVDERIKLVEEFNENPSIQVFLISLKAGGTGLNLTGADMVIHYDPWWNLSAENQATDRAYRIGQKNNVQVYKLITKNSIEEKIYELQNRKADLIDHMLSTQTTFVNKLSKEEIMQLFS